MNKRIKKLWIKALRSGSYKQTRGTLRTRDAFCCLGVLCDIHRQVTGKRWRNTNGDYSYGGNNAVLPDLVMEWASLSDNDPPLGRTVNQQVRAAGLNDSGRDFEYIADRIEKYL